MSSRTYLVLGCMCLAVACATPAQTETASQESSTTIGANSFSLESGKSVCELFQISDAVVHAKVTALSDFDDPYVTFGGDPQSWEGQSTLATLTSVEQIKSSGGVMKARMLLIPGYTSNQSAKPALSVGDESVFFLRKHPKLTDTWFLTYADEGRFRLLPSGGVGNGHVKSASASSYASFANELKTMAAGAGGNACAGQATSGAAGSVDSSASDSSSYVPANQDATP